MTRVIARRAFLRFALVAGAAAGCSPSTSAPPLPSPAAASVRFRLENDSISYQPHPRGCDQTGVRGSARGADGAPQSGLAIRLWEEDPAQAITLVLDSDGFYAMDVHPGLTDKTYRIQLIDSGGAPLSDVIVAASIPDCRFNSMVVNFIAEP